MKANFRKLKRPIEDAFHIRKDTREVFDDAWHYHDMLELVYIEQGKGERYIGDSIEAFKKGDIILVGSKLPHVWRSNIAKNKANHPKKRAVAIVIQFPIDFFGNHFSELSESIEIKQLIKRAERGIAFKGNGKKILTKQITALLTYKGMERLIKFLEMLYTLALFEKYDLLASPHFINTIYSNDLKINKAFEYIMEHFKEELKLSDVAANAGMNKTAFCRFFKNKTKKTFSNFLNEIRIGYACKLIREDNLTIVEALYGSGYSSPSYFYKNFKLIKGISPTEYQSNLTN
ncbi:AraC family transcriptional regulator [Tamlana sp. 2201CG12-4]|uniref:AraC family transcriptional regulator n=1 Tax=Tamlana sp. 2201CG12-4 TaxID=3112582 RepID=UPI002DBCFD41|nr:AraC family transcriptional regulator [Tamlana sp. 2201CG12-4]MEC3907881.1 AraC family transcriptional regulator [Tamlana sp. 2201CG12-4]